MKKTTRLLALVLAVIMTMSTMSVMSSAYSAFKWDGTGTSNLDYDDYDDADTASFTTSQYATMALDEVDRMLVDAGLGEIDLLGMATLELNSVDGALKSVSSLVTQLKDALSMLGDAALLSDPLTKLGSVNRSMSATANGWAVAAGNTDADAGLDSDLLVIYSVLDLLGCSQIGQVIEKYADGSLSVGMLDSAIASYKFDIRGIALSALIKVAETYELDEYGSLDDWDIIDDLSKVTDTSTQFYKDYYTVGTQSNQYKTGALLIANQALTKFVLGDWTKLTADNTYEGGDKTCETVWGDYYWKTLNSDGSLTPVPETDDDYAAPNWEKYDYYGFVHPDGWVTFGLGDAIRVEKNTTAPSASYTCVDLAAAKYKIKDSSTNYSGYDFIENLIVQAYNGIAVPVLNRLVVKWLHEKMGYEFLTYKEEKYYDDLSADDKAKAKKGALDTDEGKYLNASYDYCYLGEETKAEGTTTDRLMDIFNGGTIEIKRYTPVENETFVQNLNSTLGAIVEQALKTGTNPDDPHEISWEVSLATDEDESEEEESEEPETRTATWTWLTSKNTTEKPFADNGNLFKNLCSLVRFVLEYTENDFFGTDAINRGEVKNYDWLVLNGEAAASETTTSVYDQKLLAYILRVVLNSSIDEIYIKEDTSESLGTVAYHLVEQWANTIVPYLNYTMPTATDIYTSTYNEALLKKIIVMLLDIAANTLNMDLDANVGATAVSYTNHNVNKNENANTTGQVAYLGDVTDYSGTLQTLTTWAVKIYAPLLSMYNQSSYTTETNFWSLLDTVVNNILPLHTMTSGGTSQTIYGLLDEDIYNNRTSGYTGIQELLFNYLLLPILNLDNTGKIFKLFDKGTETAFSGTQDFEKIIITILGLVFDDLFPYAFDWDKMTDLDSIMNNSNISGFLKRVLNNLSAHSSFTGSDNKSHTGRGKDIAYVALPIVCMVLDLSDSQEFGELENTIDGTITTKDTSFQIYNGTSGINSAYLGTGSKEDMRVIDKPYNYVNLKAYIDNVTDTSDEDVSISLGVTTLAPGKFAKYTLANLTTGCTYLIRFTYDVTDETATLESTDADGVETYSSYLAEGLQSATYVYVGTEQTTEVTQAYTNGTLTYTSDIYTTGGLSTGWSASYKNNKDVVAVETTDEEGNKVTSYDYTKNIAAVEVTSVVLTGPDGKTISGFGLSSDTADTSYTVVAKSTQTISPYGYAENANFRRTEYVYKTTSAGVVYDEEYGLAVVDHIKTAAEYAKENPTANAVTWLPNGIYTLTTTIKVDNEVKTITQRIHMYEEYGLENLFNNEVAKNYTQSSLNEKTKDNFTDYSTALKNTAGFVLAPKTETFNPTTITTTDYLPTTYGGTTTFVNAYQQYYAYLYKAINSVTPKAAGASSIYTLLKGMVDVNEYESQTVTINGTPITANFLKSKEYDSVDAKGKYTTKFVGQIDYAGTYYNTFRDAMHEAEDLIARDQAYNGVNITYDDYCAIIDADEKAIWDEQILAWINWEGKGTIGTTEAAIVEHKLENAWSRLASYKFSFSHDDAVKMLSNATTAYTADGDEGDYTKTSYKNFERAYNFAKATINDSSATLDQINTAYCKYIQSYKELAPAVNKEPLVEFVTNVLNYGYIDEEESETYEQYFNSEVYNIASLISYDETSVSSVDITYLDLSSDDIAYEAKVIDGGEIVLFGDDQLPFYTIETYQKFVNALYTAALYCTDDYDLDSVNQRDSLIKAITDAIAGLERYSNEEEPSGGYSYEFIFDEDVDNWTAEQKEYFIDSDIAKQNSETGEYGFTVNETQYWIPAVDKVTVSQYAEEILSEEIAITGEDGSNYVITKDDKEITIDGYLVGMPAEADEDTIKMMFANTEGCKVVVEPTDNDGYGTGAIVLVMDETEETTYETLLVIYRSDVTGDGVGDGEDVTSIKRYVGGFSDAYDWENINSIHKLVAADVNADGTVDAADASAIKWSIGGETRNGIDWSDIWQPAGNGENMGEYPFLSTEE